jgi:hypothetical protein
MADFNFDNWSFDNVLSDVGGQIGLATLTGGQADFGAAAKNAAAYKDAARKRQMEKELPSLLSNLDPNDPEFVLKLAPHIGVAEAFKIQNQMADNAHTNAMMQGLGIGLIPPAMQQQQAQPQQQPGIDAGFVPNSGAIKDGQVIPMGNQQPQMQPMAQPQQQGGGLMDRVSPEAKQAFGYDMVLGGKPNPEILLKDVYRQQDMKVAQDKLAKEQASEGDLKKIGDYEFMGQGVPDKEVVKEVRAEAITQKRLDQSLDSLEKTIAEGGKSIVPGTPQYKKLKGILSDIRNAERKIGATGVLNVGELPFLEENYGAFDPTKFDNYLTSTPDQLLSELQDYKQRRRAGFDSAVEVYGYGRKNAPAKAASNLAPQDLDNMSLEQLQQLRAQMAGGAQ